MAKISYGRTRGLGIGADVPNGVKATPSTRTGPVVTHGLGVVPVTNLPLSSIGNVRPKAGKRPDVYKI